MKDKFTTALSPRLTLRLDFFGLLAPRRGTVAQKSSPTSNRNKV
jgi:hypothetical protein